MMTLLLMRILKSRVKVGIMRGTKMVWEMRRHHHHLHIFALRSIQRKIISILTITCRSKERLNHSIHQRKIHDISSLMNMNVNYVLPKIKTLMLDNKVSHACHGRCGIW